MNTTRINKTKNTRSRSGCLTCRQRKKKCDELLFPVCQNCLGKHLECKWSRQIVDLHNKLKQVKYVGRGKTGAIIPTDLQDTNTPVESKLMTKKDNTAVASVACDTFSFASTPASSSALTPAIASLDEDILSVYTQTTYPWDDIDTGKLELFHGEEENIHSCEEQVSNSAFIATDTSGSVSGQRRNNITYVNSAALPDTLNYGTASFLRHSQIQVVKPQYQSTRRGPSHSTRIIDKIAYQEDVTE